MPNSSDSRGPVQQDHVIKLPRPLDQSQVQSFVDDGFLIVPEVISQPELDELKQDTADLARGKYPCPSLESLSPDTPDEQVLKNILCIHMPHYISPVMRKYVSHPSICSILSQITAAHLPHWDGSVKCMQSMLFVKPPGFQGQAWHQDEIYIPTRDRSLVGAWIAIDDATIENGCLWVLPASHQSGFLYSQRAHNRPDEFDLGEESHGFDDSNEVPVEVKAGTLVFFNGYLLHRSRKNRGNLYRRVLVNHYMNAWSLLPWRCQTKDQHVPAAKADYRCIVPVAGVDPYAWKGLDTDSQGVYLRTCPANTPE